MKKIIFILTSMTLIGCGNMKLDNFSDNKPVLKLKNTFWGKPQLQVYLLTDLATLKDNSLLIWKAFRKRMLLF